LCAPRPVAGAEAAAFATEGYQMLSAENSVTYPQEAMFETAASQVILELALNITR
jgi:hypothetical protein